MVLLRTWRKDEDGTYIVLYQSAHHRSAREGGGGWFGPVRAQVQAAGFTIAPLLPRYTHNGESRECLVTLVLKADLGGSLAARALGPLSSFAVQAVLEPVVTSIIVLRDKVGGEGGGGQERLQANRAAAVAAPHRSQPC